MKRHPEGARLWRWEKVAIIITSLALVAGLAIIAYFATVSRPAVIPVRVAPPGMTVYIVPPVAFTAQPSNIDFGETKPGNTSAPWVVTISNDGARPLLITCSVSDEVGLYTNNLELDGEKWDSLSAIIERGSYRQINTTLTVPENYRRADQQAGMLVFWAAEAKEQR